MGCQHQRQRALIREPATRNRCADCLDRRAGNERSRDPGGLMRVRTTTTLRRTTQCSAAVALSVALAACGQQTGGAGGGAGDAVDYPSETIEIMVPAAAGGGWD